MSDSFKDDFKTKKLKLDENKFLKKLMKIQKKLSKKVVTKDLFPKPIKTVAAFDISYKNKEAFVAGVVCDYEDLKVIETVKIKDEINFPYFPNFLFFREGPSIIRSYFKLRINPDVILIDGHGIAHPLKLGVASHIGVSINKPTIGIAKNKLIGEIENFENGIAKLYFKGKQVGWAVKRMKYSPIFISPGHMVSIETSLEIAKKCLKNSKIPEPLRIAHEIANYFKKVFKKKNLIYYNKK